MLSARCYTGAGLRVWPSSHYAPDGCDLDDEDAWAQANPALDDFLARDALRATLPPASREAAVRRFRLGQWAGQAESWVDWSTWASAADARRVIPDGAPPSSAA